MGWHRGQRGRGAGQTTVSCLVSACNGSGKRKYVFIAAAFHATTARPRRRMGGHPAPTGASTRSRQKEPVSRKGGELVSTQPLQGTKKSGDTRLALYGGKPVRCTPWPTYDKGAVFVHREDEEAALR